MRVYKITPGEGTCPYIEPNPAVIVDWLTDAELGEKITVDVLEMSEKEYKGLPEYTGP